MGFKPIHRFLSGFSVLFACYHAAEYMILFQNSATGFLLCSGFFFVAAQYLARWQFGTGNRAWGMRLSSSEISYGLAGLLTGLLVYTLIFMLELLMNISVISSVPPLSTFATAGLPLVLGSFCSSLSEDVLTRGYIFRHWATHTKPVTLIMLSAGIYTANHIYRLDEPTYLLFILLTGIHLSIPLLLTRNIWYTVGMHWAGNIVYHLTNNVMHTEDGSSPVPALWFMCGFMALLIPINFFICKMMADPMKKIGSSIDPTVIRQPIAVIHQD